METGFTPFTASHNQSEVDQMSIGVALRYELLNDHRPPDRESLRREVLVLYARGLTQRDIADSLRLDATSVRELLTGGEVTP
jgi:DNA-binding NarL/FixJ family response regulator